MDLLSLHSYHCAKGGRKHFLSSRGEEEKKISNIGFSGGMITLEKGGKREKKKREGGGLSASPPARRKERLGVNGFASQTDRGIKRGKKALNHGRSKKQN